MATKFSAGHYVQNLTGRKGLVVTTRPQTPEVLVSWDSNGRTWEESATLRPAKHSWEN